MAKKVENKDIFGDDLFKDPIKGAERLIEFLDMLEGRFKRVGKAARETLDQEDGDTVESINKINEALNDTTKAVKLNEKVLKDRAKLQQRLSAARSEEIKENVELQVQLQEQNKINKQLARESLNLVGAYERESKRLRSLKNEYRDLITEQGKTTKESRKLLREIKSLDRELKDLDETVGDNFRQVGNYERALEGVEKQFKNIVATGAAVVGTFKGIEGSLNATEEGSEDLRKASAGLDGAFNKIKSTGASLLLDLFDIGKAVKDLATGEGGFGSIGAIAGNAFSRTNKATENFVEDIENAVNAEIEAEQKTIDFEKSLRVLELRIARLNGEIAEQISLTGDSTRSFDQIDASAEAAQQRQVERSRLLLQIANEELDIVRTRLEERRKAGLNVIDLLNQENEALIKVQEAENELLEQTLENDKVRRENARDRFERELDFAIDAFDATKTIGERQIADEEINLERRREIFNELDRLTQSSFQNQIKLVQEFTDQKIDLDSLARESDEEAIRARLRAFNFDDVTLGRILEIIRERKIAIQDLAETQRDLNNSEQEAIDLRKELLVQEEALAGGTTSEEDFEQLEEERFNIQKESLERRIELLEDGSIEELRLRKELNDLLLQEQEKLNAEQEELTKQSLERQQELTETVLQVISDLADSDFERNIDRLDEQIADSQDRVDQLSAKAEESRLDADESIAFERQKEAEAERERERERQRQQRTQALLTVFSAYQSNVNNGEEDPLGKTIADVGVLTALAQAFGTGFFEGTDDTGSTGKLKDKNGPITGFTHANEAVIEAERKKQIDKKNNTSLGTRDFISKAVDSYAENQLLNSMMLNGMLDNTVKTDKETFVVMDKRLLSKIDTLNDTLKIYKNDGDGLDIDEVKNVLIYTQRRGRRTIKTVSRLHD